METTGAGAVEAEPRRVRSARAVSAPRRGSCGSAGTRAAFAAELREESVTRRGGSVDPAPSGATDAPRAGPARAAHCHPHRHSLEADDRGGPARRDDAPGLAPFAPPPPALLPELTGPQAPGNPGSAASHAETAALVERLVRSLRVGRVGREGREVHLRVALRGSLGVVARLRLSEGELTAVIEADPAVMAEADRIAATLERELRERGVRLADVRVQRQA